MTPVDVTKKWTFLPSWGFHQNCFPQQLPAIVMVLTVRPSLPSSSGTSLGGLGCSPLRIISSTTPMAVSTRVISNSRRSVQVCKIYRFINFIYLFIGESLSEPHTRESSIEVVYACLIACLCGPGHLPEMFHLNVWSEILLQWRHMSCSTCVGRSLRSYTSTALSWERRPSEQGKVSGFRHAASYDSGLRQLNAQIDEEVWQLWCCDPLPLTVMHKECFYSLLLLIAYLGFALLELKES